MKVTTHTSAEKFLEAVGAWLETQEALNNLMLGVAAQMAHLEEPPEQAPVMITVSRSEGPLAAALMTPPRPIVLYAPTDDPHETLDGLAEALIAGGHAVSGCVGPGATADVFAGVWSERTGQAAVKKMAQRIYELRKVRLPQGVCGSARLPGVGDLDRLARWTHEFRVAVGEPSDPESSRESARALITDGQALFWEDQGRPVSMAAAGRPTRHGIAIRGVYTPPAHRRHGYASACVAELSQRQLDAGRQFCCLYTDLANPTSNKIYQGIGYVPVADSSHYRFEAAVSDASG